MAHPWHAKHQLTGQAHGLRARVGNLYSTLIRRRIEHTLGRLSEARRSRDARVVQSCYDDLFCLCYKNHLDLPAILHDAETPPHSAAA